MTSFPITGTPRLRVSVPAGSVTAQAVDGATETTVELRPADGDSDSANRLIDRARVEQDGDTVVDLQGDWGFLRRVPRIDCVIRTVTGAGLDLKVASADVQVLGRWGAARLASASGDVRVEEADGEVEVKGASGDVTVRRAGGEATVTTASGTVTISEAAGDVDAKTASGDVSVDRVGGSLHHVSASGDLRVRTAAGRSVSAQTASGDVTVGVAPGRATWLDLSAISGRVSSELPVSDDRPGDAEQALSLRIRTVSGDISVCRSESPQV